MYLNQILTEGRSINDIDSTIITKSHKNKL